MDGGGPAAPRLQGAVLGADPGEAAAGYRNLRFLGPLSASAVCGRPAREYAWVSFVLK